MLNFYLPASQTPLLLFNISFVTIFKYYNAVSIQCVKPQKWCLVAEFNFQITFVLKKTIRF